jgi:hypothetical protein
MKVIAKHDQFRAEVKENKKAEQLFLRTNTKKEADFGPRCRNPPPQN